MVNEWAGGDLHPVDPPHEKSESPTRLAALVWIAGFLIFGGVEVYAVLIWDGKWALVGGIILVISLIVGAAVSSLEKGNKR